jgi:hypothetical protein
MMKTCTLAIALFFLLIAGSSLTASTGHAVASLGVNDPLETVVADLEAFIPAYVEQQGVPGVVIALVRDGRPCDSGNSIRTCDPAVTSLNPVWTPNTRKRHP